MCTSNIDFTNVCWEEPGAASEVGLQGGTVGCGWHVEDGVSIGGETH